MSSPVAEFSDPDLESVLLDLESVSAVKFGDFLLKSGLRSPVYFDLRVIVSHPDLMVRVSRLLWRCRHPDAPVDVLCGVPYTALPLATLIAAENGVPMLIRRKEAKAYGTKKAIEGKFARGDRCLIVEDVVTSGSSVMETASALSAEGMSVTDAVVLLDREQGGSAALAEGGIRLRSVCGVVRLMDVLVRNGRVDEETRAKVLDFVRNNQVKAKKEESAKPDVTRMSLEERANPESNPSPVSRLVLETMIRKRSNLCVAADVGTAEELLALTVKLAPFVCAVKTHVDALKGWNRDAMEKLVALSEEGDFLLFEDRKLSDIGATVEAQYSALAADWAHLVTAHGVAGPGTMEGVAKAVRDKGLEGRRGVVVVAQMSSGGNLATEEYSRACVSDLCDAFPDLAAGLVSQSRLSPRPEVVQFTPGVNLGASGDALGQRYVTPEAAVGERGCDVVIVGRGVTAAESPEVAADDYRRRAWDALVDRTAKK